MNVTNAIPLPFQSSLSPLEGMGRGQKQYRGGRSACSAMAEAAVWPSRSGCRPQSPTLWAVSPKNMYKKEGRWLRRGHQIFTYLSTIAIFFSGHYLTHFFCHYLFPMGTHFNHLTAFSTCCNGREPSAPYRGPLAAFGNPP